MRRRPKNLYDFTTESPYRDSIHSLPFYVGLIIILILTGLFGLVFVFDSILPRPLTINDQYSPYRDSIHGLPFYVGLIIILIFTGLFGLVCVFDSILPRPLTINHQKAYPNSFIAERATLDLKNLTDLGPKVVGSYENEFLAVNYLTRRINSIIQEAHSNQQLELDVQVVTGAYYLLHLANVLNSYDRVQNIVVKLYGKNNSNSSILVNSHFDSVPTSPGGSDDGINVAVMLEILRIFSVSKERPLHNIVFLFNGAEETPLQASHGFITQHKWAKECKVVVNLDAAGAGGKIILFQTGPQTPWLVKYYSQVPHPYGQAGGEEIFQSGIIPSDTDFRIFRDFGGLVGLDMAFIKNGYRYHTKYDRFSNIPPGSYQHVGDNTLFLLQSLGNAPEVLENLPSEGKAVFYDFFGLFMISYTSFVGLILNVVSVILSLGIFLYSTFSFRLGFSKSTLKYLAVTLGAILGSWILTALFIFITAVIIDLLGRSMSWYANPWFIYGLYVIPTVGISGCLLFLTNHENISLSIRCQIQCHIVRLIWTIVLAVGVSLNIRTMYAVMIPVLFSSLAFLVIHATRLQHSVKRWQIVYAVFLLVPSMNLMYQILTTLSLFVPMTGRIGSDKNPELIIGFMTFFLGILVLSPWTILTNSLRKAEYYFIVLGLVFITCLIIVFTPLGFPYSGNSDCPRPQRQWILHTSRKFFNESGDLIKTDAGFFFLNMDRNSPYLLRSHVKDLRKAVPLSKDCSNYAGCGLPLSHPYMMNIMEYSTWIPAGQPVLPEPVNLKSNSEKISPTLLKYNVIVTGPDRFTFYLVPRENISLLNISFSNEVPQPARTFYGRPMYFILYQLGKGDMNLSFDFTVEVPENWEGPTVNLTVVGRYVHENKMRKTPQFLNLLNQIPDWADVTAWLGTYYAYMI